MMEIPIELRRRAPAWPTVRALIIAVAIAIGLVDGAPIPTPRVMERLPASMREASIALRDLQTALLAPWRPIKELFAVNQRWAVFSTTGGLRYRMWVEARTGPTGSWTLLYRAHDRDHTLFADTLGYRRVRNVYNPSRSIGAKGTYPALPHGSRARSSNASGASTRYR
jgi:hypothetical protein